jgi:hypothetical protein
MAGLPIPCRRFAGILANASHGSGPMWIAIPSSARTCTSYSFPISWHTCVKTAEDNPVRVIDVFVDELDLRALGFEHVAPKATGPPAYHPARALKIYVYD